MKGCEAIKPWIEDIVNHFWFCCQSCNRDVEELKVSKNVTTFKIIQRWWHVDFFVFIKSISRTTGSHNGSDLQVYMHDCVIMYGTFVVLKSVFPNYFVVNCIWNRTLLNLKRFQDVLVNLTNLFSYRIHGLAFYITCVVSTAGEVVNASMTLKRFQTKKKLICRNHLRRWRPWGM